MKITNYVNYAKLLHFLENLVGITNLCLSSKLTKLVKECCISLGTQHFSIKISFMINRLNAICTVPITVHPMCRLCHKIDFWMVHKNGPESLKARIEHSSGTAIKKQRVVWTPAERFEKK